MRGSVCVCVCLFVCVLWYLHDAVSSGLLYVVLLSCAGLSRCEVLWVLSKLKGAECFGSISAVLQCRAALSSGVVRLCSVLVGLSNAVPQWVDK